MKEDNLIPMAERSEQERREISQKGGIASGEARRQKKLARQIAIEYWNGEITSQSGEKMTRKDALIMKYLASVNKDPKTKDIDFVLALIGEEVERKQTHVIEGVQITDEDKQHFEEIFGMNVK